MTRRELAAFLVASPALAAPAQSAPESAPPEDQLAREKREIRETVARLAKAKLDIAEEPAFRFQA
ncbi:MAG TPA: hypothetical protein VMJ34_01425 [Bryobacteraceae bacterium]|nr:hypothetical protein [Bryobacteraceae bacterium]